MDSLKIKIDEVLRDAGTLEIARFYSDLQKREQRTTFMFNLLNKTLKIAASLILMFLFVRAYHIESEYEKLKPYELVAIEFCIEEIPVKFRSSEAGNLTIQYNTYVGQYNYKAAAELAIKAYNQTKCDGWCLMAGQALLHSANYTKALEFLAKIKKGSAFHEASLFYKFGTYLATQDIEKAERTAKELYTTEGYYSKKMKRLKTIYL